MHTIRYYMLTLDNENAVLSLFPWDFPITNMLTQQVFP